MLMREKLKKKETVKIRSCVVRLKRMKTQTQTIKMTRSVVKGQPPLKKRPVAASTIISKPETSFKAKERVRTPIIQRTTKIIQQKRTVTPTVEELPPTIAAGRSRRAVKPNPKYASEDMVTPRNLKARRDTETEGRQRRNSGSSIDDFYNKESSDEELEEQVDTEDDKEYTIVKEIAHDSDFADATDSDTPAVQKRPRGRPRKIIINDSISQRRTTTGAPTILNKSAPNPKTQPTQLQQLRKTLGASTVSPLSLNRKRKLDESSASNMETKRFHLSSTGGLSSEAKGVATRRSSPSLVLNGSKRTSSGATEVQKRDTMIATVQEKKLGTTLKSPVGLANQRTVAQSNNKVQLTYSRGGMASKVSLNSKQPNTQSAVPSRLTAAKPKAVEAAKERNSNSKSEDSPKKASDDFETMPTFTIVNINDIINKKGDVLISKARPADAKTERRGPVSSQQQQQQNKILANKITPERFKNSQQFRTSTPFMRKPMEKSVNTSLHKILGRNNMAGSAPSSIGKAASVADRKPAPRILNSVVGRRTQPVKPMIANLNDSPNRSLSLFDDDDDDIEDDDALDDSKDSTSSDIDEERMQKKRRMSTASRSYNTAASNNKIKSNEPKTSTKENSAAATNRLPQSQTAQSPKSDGRKQSPEKVVISKQGDKIIKKITCFETWYVINIPADAPEEYQRNSLNMPLIELANEAKEINLPSEKWTSKVTLYELASTTLAKTNMVLYTGDLADQNINEEDRAKYQPSCVMFRRAVSERVKAQLPYDRAVIFKNKTFFTNIEGKNVKLVGAPSTIGDISEVETLLHIVDTLTLQSSFVEPAATVL